MSSPGPADLGDFLALHLAADGVSLTTRQRRRLLGYIVAGICQGAMYTPGARVRIAGLGTFARVERPARLARNPRTGEPVAVPARAVLRFKPAKGTAR